MREFVFGALVQPDVAVPLYGAAAVLGGLGEAQVRAWGVFEEHCDPERLPEQVLSLVRAGRAVEAYVAWLDALWEQDASEDEWGSEFDEAVTYPVHLEDPRLWDWAMERYRAGDLTARQLVGFDRRLWEAEIDDALDAGWYAFFRDMAFAGQDRELLKDGSRLLRLLECTESNCCLRAVTLGDVERSLEPPLWTHGTPFDTALLNRRIR
ncbi:MAG: hypothetical protein KDA28_10860, partial [Phycisphaerales bacterium]|nr:hypothetical protein [Phycisphaerales bacterium]